MRITKDLVVYGKYLTEEKFLICATDFEQALGNPS